MPMHHALDQHCAPDVLYLIDRQHVPPAVKASEPFAPAMDKIFGNVTGLNPRRRAIDETDPFFVAVRRAQACYMARILGRTPVASDIDSVPGAVPFSCTHVLDQGWLSVMIGVRTIKHKGQPLLVMQHPDRRAFVPLCMGSPSRGKTEAKIATEEQRTSAIANFEQMLKTGAMSVRRAPLRQWSECKVRLTKEKEFELHVGDQPWSKWDDARNLTIEFPIFELPASGGSGGLSPTGSQLPAGAGVVEDFEARVRQLTLQTPANVVRFALSILRSTDSAVPRLSRDGKGVYQHVPFAAHGAFHYLCELAQLCPSILAMVIKKKRADGRLLAFDVRHAPALEWLQQHVILQATTAVGEEKKKASAFEHLLSWPIGQTPWKHQTETIQAMERRRQNGQRGHTIWQSTGAGKTNSVLAALRGSGADHLIWSVSDLAYTSIIARMREFGQPADKIKVLLPIKGVSASARATWGSHMWALEEHTDAQTGELELPSGTGWMFLVAPDHLRRPAFASIERIAPRAFVMQDEMHDILRAGTQRAAFSMALCSMAVDFAGATGTPTINHKFEGIDRWFQMCCNYPVDKATIPIAIGSAIHADLKPESEAHITPIEAGWPNAEMHSAYQALVPPSCGGTCSLLNKSHANMRKAFHMCTGVSEQAMLTGAVAHVQLGQGGVMIVAKTHDARDEYLKGLVAHGVDRKSICALGLDCKGLELTDAAVAAGATADYPFVIAQLNTAQGYQLSRLKAIFMVVMDSNQVRRTQAAARVARPGQSSKTVPVFVYHIGVRTMQMQWHLVAASHEKLVEDFVKHAWSA